MWYIGSDVITSVPTRRCVFDKYLEYLVNIKVGNMRKSFVDHTFKNLTNLILNKDRYVTGQQ